MGVVGLETAFAVCYTHLVKTGILPLEKLIALLSDQPRKRFGITSDAGYSVWDLEAMQTVDPETFLSMGRSTPFAGTSLYGKNLLTVYNEKIVYQA